MMLAKKEYFGQGETRKQKIYKTITIKNRKYKIHSLVKVGVCLMLLISINLILQAGVLQQHYQVIAMQNMLADVDRQILQTKLEIASLDSIKGVYSRAQEKLQMKVAQDNDYQYVVTDKSVQEISRDQKPVAVSESAAQPKVSFWKQVANFLGKSQTALADNP